MTEALVRGLSLLAEGGRLPAFFCDNRVVITRLADDKFRMVVPKGGGKV